MFGIFLLAGLQCEAQSFLPSTGGLWIRNSAPVPLNVIAKRLDVFCNFTLGLITPAIGTIVITGTPQSFPYSFGLPYFPTNYFHNIQLTVSLGTAPNFIIVPTALTWCGNITTPIQIASGGGFRIMLAASGLPSNAIIIFATI